MGLKNSGVKLRKFVKYAETKYFVPLKAFQQVNDFAEVDGVGFIEGIQLAAVNIQYGDDFPVAVPDRNHDFAF